MKLLKRDRKELESVLSQARTGLKFLMAQNVAVMIESKMSSSDVFRAPYYPEKAYSTIAKDVGSEIVFIASAISKLERLLSLDGATL